MIANITTKVTATDINEAIIFIFLHEELSGINVLPQYMHLYFPSFRINECPMGRWRHRLSISLPPTIIKSYLRQPSVETKHLPPPLVIEIHFGFWYNLLVRAEDHVSLHVVAVHFIKSVTLINKCQTESLFNNVVIIQFWLINTISIPIWVNRRLTLACCAD